jgi:hypothetical protein
MSEKIAFLVVAICSALIFGGAKYLGQQPIPEDSHYVGSVACSSCHINEHSEWHASLHTQMMRKVDKPNTIVADLHSEDIAFDPAEAVWAIGGKWEQQFMGEEDGTETLLPGAWLVKDKKWKNTGWDGWKKPQPVERCHGCHSVGLNVETGDFVEESVGCESCHGPSSWHVNTAGIGKVSTGIDPQVCGQCHSRGRSKDGNYFFPEGYKPGLKLDDFFNHDEPDMIQNSNKWWANGHPRKRHQEYSTWEKGGHSNSLKSLTENYDGEYGEVTSKCLSCHAGEAIMDDQSEDYNLEEVEYGITCTVCHNSHGELDKPRVECSSCHGDGASHHKPEVNRNHVPCPTDAKVECQQCHMPLTVMNGGDYTLHSHLAGIIPPEDTRKFGVPNSCANGGCHDDKSIDWLENAYSAAYK